VKRYTVDFKRDERGWWVASIREIRGCHTQARSIQQARRRLREALSLFVDDAVAQGASFDEKVHLTQPIHVAVAKSHAARKRADAEAQAAARSTRAAVKLLTGRLKVSARDAGEILNLSHQRVQQLRRLV